MLSFFSVGSNKIVNPHYLLVVSLFFDFFLISSFTFSLLVQYCTYGVIAYSESGSY